MEGGYGLISCIPIVVLLVSVLWTKRIFECIIVAIAIALFIGEGDVYKRQTNLNAQLPSQQKSMLRGRINYANDQAPTPVNANSYAKQVRANSKCQNSLCQFICQNKLEPIQSVKTVCANDQTAVQIS